MKYICMGYYDPAKLAAMTEEERNAMFKRVGLHYIAFSELARATTKLVPLPTSKILEFASPATNFG